MSSFTLKIIAIISMLFDHAGYAIYGKLSWCNFIGRLAFPIFAFQITEGYIHTKNLKKYFLRLGLFALISQIPLMMLYSMFTTNFVFNIFFTLMLGLLTITIFDKCPNKILGTLGALLVIYISKFLNVDYGFLGVLTIFMFYVFKNNKILTSLAFIVLTICQYKQSLIATNFSTIAILLVVFTLLPLLLIFLYNGKKGKNIKQAFYWFYPVHLVLLYFINILLINQSNNLSKTFYMITNFFKL